MLLIKGLHALARRQEMLWTWNFFFVIDSHYQLLTELKIKIYLDKYPNFASKAEKGCLFFFFFFFFFLNVHN